MDILQQMNLTDFTLYDLINVKGVGKSRVGDWINSEIVMFYCDA